MARYKDKQQQVIVDHLVQSPVHSLSEPLLLLLKRPSNFFVLLYKHLPTAPTIDGTPLRRGHQPRSGIFRDTFFGPPLKACNERVLARPTLTLEDAVQRAKANSQQLLSADIAARIAREDRIQARAALLPTLNWENGFVYTQPNGTETGVFVGARLHRSGRSARGCLLAGQAGRLSDRDRW